MKRLPIRARWGEPPMWRSGRVPDWLLGETMRANGPMRYLAQSELAGAEIRLVLARREW